jgi:hypothetical protein
MVAAVVTILTACHGAGTLAPDTWTEPLTFWTAAADPALVTGLDLSLAPDGRLFVAWVASVGIEEPSVWATLRHDGGWLPARRIDSPPPPHTVHRVGVPFVGADDHAGALMIWSEQSPPQPRSFWYSRYDGRNWTSPSLVAGPGNVRIATAVNGRGDALVIWAEGPDLRSASFDSREGWTPPVFVARAEPGTLVQPEAAVMSDGDAVTLWTDSSPSSTSLAVVRRQDGHWQRPEMVADGRAFFRPHLALGREQSVIVAWSERVASSSDHVRASLATRPGTWARILDVPGTEPRLARSAEGDVAVIAASDIFEPSAIWMRRFDGEGFGPAEYVRAPRGAAGLATHPALALGGGRRDLASWWETASGSDVVGDLWTAGTDRSGAFSPPERMRYESASNRACDQPAPVTDLPPRPVVTASGVATVVWSEQSCGTVRLAASSRVLPVP